MPTVEELLKLIGAMHLDSLTYQKRIADLEAKVKELTPVPPISG